MLHLRIPISARLAFWLFIGVAVLVAIDIAVTFGQFSLGITLPSVVASKIDLAAEGSIPTWYASAQLLLAGLILGLIATDKWLQRDSQRWAWSAMAIGFAYLSLDEAAEIHEMWGLLVGDSVGQAGIFYFQWTVVALVLLPILLLVFWRFLSHLELKTRLAMVASGAVFLGGAVGLELVGGALAASGERGSHSYAMLNAGENGLELLGIAMFIATLLRYASIMYPDNAFHVKVRASGLRLGLAVLVAVVLCLSVGATVLGSRVAGVPYALVRLFDVLKERNVPTWYTSMLLGVCALLSALIMASRRRLENRVRRGWAIITMALVIFSIDEVSEIHESLTAWIQAQGLWGFPAWGVIGGLLLLAILVLVWPALRRLPVGGRISLAAAASTWVAGAWLCPILLESLNRVAGRGFGVAQLGEALELAGASLMLVALAKLLSTFEAVVRTGRREAPSALPERELSV